MKRVKRESKRPSHLRSSQFEIDANILKKDRYKRLKTKCSDSEQSASDDSSPPVFKGCSERLKSELSKERESTREEEEIKDTFSEVSDAGSPVKKTREDHGSKEYLGDRVADTSPQTTDSLLSSGLSQIEKSELDLDDSDNINVIGDSQSSVEREISFSKIFHNTRSDHRQGKQNEFQQSREQDDDSDKNEKNNFQMPDENEQTQNVGMNTSEDGMKSNESEEKKKTSEESGSSGEIFFKASSDYKNERFEEFSENDFVSDEHLVSDDKSDNIREEKKGEQEERTESEGSSDKNEKCKEDRRFELHVTNREWLKFAAVETRSKEGLGRGWSDFLYDKFSKRNTQCCLVFKRNRLRKEGSRKQNAPYFTAKANCRFRKCTSFVFTVRDVPAEGEDVQIDVQQEGLIRHEEGAFYKRKLTGEKRKEVAQAAKEKGPSTLHYEKLSKMPSETFVAGNMTDANSKEVIRKALSELNVKDRLHKDSFCGMILLQDILHQEDDESQYTKGYIQFLSYEPFLTIMFTENQIQMVKEKVKMGRAKLFLDATGSIVTNMNEKRVLYYALTMKAEEKGIPPLPVSEMLSTDQTTVAISLFLSKTLHSLKKIHTEPMIQKVEIDFSWAMINSVIKTFANMSVSEYIQAAWRSYVNMQDFHHTVAHVCCFHTLKRFQERISKYSKDFELKKFIAFSFGLLINSSDPPTARALWSDIHLALSQETRCACVRRALGNLNARITLMSHADEDVKGEIPITDYEESVEDVRHKLSLREGSPFCKYFKQPKNQCLCEETTRNLNEYQCLEAITVIKDYLPLYPLWSGMLLRSDTSTLTRDSTSVAENWFRIVKNDILQKKKKIQPAVFAQKLHLSLKGRLRQHKMSAMKASMKKPREKKRETSPDLSEEKWGQKRTDKKKKQSKFFSPPPKIPKPKQKKSKSADTSKDAASSKRSPPSEHGYVGLVNSKNSCWLNSSAQMFLQMLSTTDFKSLRQKPVRHAISSSFLATLEDLTRNEPDVGTMEGVLDSFDATVDIDPGRQNDAAAFVEFMLLELAAVHIHDTIELSYANSCIRCDKITSRTQDTVYLWHVELTHRARGEIDVQSCLDEYLKTETLIEPNAPWCQRCVSKTPHVRSVNLIVALKHVFIQLKRFDNQLRKDSVPITVNREIMLPFSDQHAEWNLVSVICHSGPTCKSGHYVNLAVKEDSICMIDDRSISHKPASFLTSKYAKPACYILMYKADTSVSTKDKRKQEKQDAQSEEEQKESEVDSDEEPLLQSGGLNLTKEDLKRLDLSKELNDKVMNCYLKLLETSICKMHQDNNYVCCMDTFFYTAAEREDMSQLRKWTVLKKWKHCTYIVFPVHISRHWTVLICHVKDSWLISYDSLGFHHSTIVQKISHLVKSFSPVTSLKLKECKASPKQKNNVDCGVFVCAFVKRFLLDEESPFSQSDIPRIREDMKIELTSQKIIP